jgi:hypothetical protein
LTFTSSFAKIGNVTFYQGEEETYSGKKGWYRLGQLMIKLSQCNKAEELSEILLKQTTNEDEKG